MILNLRTEDLEYDIKDMVKYKCLGLEIENTGGRESKCEGRKPEEVNEYNKIIINIKT